MLGIKNSQGIQKKKKSNKKKNPDFVDLRIPDPAYFFP